MKDARAWTKHLREHIPLALSGADPEGAHQVRVAARRLRVYLYLLGWRVLQDDLRRLVRGVGGVRDLEVALGGVPRCGAGERLPLPEGLRGFLEGSLHLARKALPPLLASPWTGALLEALDLLPPLDEGKARKRLARLEGKAEGLRLEVLAGGAVAEALHAYRRALRRVRYAKEFLGISARKEKALQEALGDLQDLEVFRSLLEGYLAGERDPEAEALRDALEKEHARCLGRALEAVG